MPQSRDVDADGPHFRNNSDQWTDWGWPSQSAPDPYVFVRFREAEQAAAEGTRPE